MEPDARTIVFIQGLRAFAYGFGSILLGSVLAKSGLSAGLVGLVFGAMLAGMALVSIGVAFWADRLGRRSSYAILLLVMGGAGTVFAFTHWLPALLLAALTGTLSTDPNESGPITSLEQAMIGNAPAKARGRIFGRYNAVAYLAGSLGALLAGGPAVMRRLIPSLPADQRWLLVFLGVGVACFFLSRRLSGGVELGAEETKLMRPGLKALRPEVRRLSTLVALDSFGGGFVVQTFMVYWFSKRFSASVEVMGLVFFLVGFLQAASSLIAARLGERIGLLNTMVFTHLPSNVLLASIPFAPTLWAAIVLLLGRSALSQMDVPTRQAYVLAIVKPEERTAAAAVTNLARYTTRPISPALAGVMIQHLALSVPFAAAGGLKIVYDLALYRTFRGVPLEGDEQSHDLSTRKERAVHEMGDVTRSEG